MNKIGNGSLLPENNYTLKGDEHKKMCLYCDSWAHQAFSVPEPDFSRDYFSVLSAQLNNI